MKSKHNFESTGQPSSDEKDLGKCEICPNYWFLSKTEKARHKSLFHRRQKLQQPQPRNHSCDVCEASFSSLSSLNRHKKEKQHTRRDQRKRQQPNDASSRKKRKTKARTIQDMMRANRDVTSSDDDSDEEACSAPTYCIEEKIIPNISDSDQDADKNDEEMLDDDLNRDEVLVSIGEYVGAIYDGKPYIGRVRDIDGGDVYVDFMEPYVKENSDHQTFKWPSRGDDVWVEKSDILCVICMPEETKRGYRFTSDTCQHIREHHAFWQEINSNLKL